MKPSPINGIKPQGKPWPLVSGASPRELNHTFSSAKAGCIGGLKRIKSRKITLFSVIFFAITFSVGAQIPNGSWRDHLAYHKANYLAITPQKVYCAFNRSGLLSYNKSSGEIEKLSRVQGLFDINPTALKYSEEAKVLIIGYSSGNIDLITHDGVLNMADIKKKNIVANKTINKIECYNNLAYLACDFGIVVIDLTKKEFKDSYIFGPGGSTIQVNDVTIYGEYIYAATELGLYKASLNSPNLLDYSNWELVTEVPEPHVVFKLVEAFGNYVLAAYKSMSTGHDEMIQLQNNAWKDWNVITDTTINEIDAYKETLSVSGINTSILLNNGLQIENRFDIYNAHHILKDDNGQVYYASFSSYGFGYFSGNEFRNIGVNGPRFNTTSKVATHDNQIWVTSGGPFDPYTEGGAYNFTDEHWTSINSGWNDGFKDLGNLYKIVYFPTDPNRIYASGYGYGLYEIDNFKFARVFNWDNTALFQNTIEKMVGVRITGLGFDSKGTLWTVFDFTSQPVYTLSQDNTWKNYELKSEIFKKSMIYVDLLVAQNDQIWILSRNNGIIVLKQESDGTILEKAFPIKNLNGDNLSYAYCLEEDKEGNIWVGTNKGPIIYYSNDDIFSQPEVLGTQIKIPRNDGTGLADYLLDYEIINEIAIDGANRKWIATENSGVFLISDDGKKTIHHFIIENSPLFSNNIIGIGVQEQTGEVFISTNLGILSYMGTATEGSDNFDNVYVYPNPIRPDYDGEITVTGLIANSFVKITDISGNLVFESKSLGGQAVWDGKNFNGKRVSTGIYMVFLSNEDGSLTHVTKLLFIH
jgi:hypothetical protein